MRRRRPPKPTLGVSADPVLRAGSEATIGIDVAEGTARVWLRLLGWDMRSAQKWPLGELGAGSHRVTLPTALPPGCARMTEYAIVAELPGKVVAERVGLISDTLWWPADEPAAAEVVPLGGTLHGHAERPSEVGAELYVAGITEPRFLPVASVEGDYAVAIGPDVPPTLHDGEDLGIAWAVRTGGSTRHFAVVDPEGEAGERRPALLTFLAQLARDPFALRPG